MSDVIKSIIYAIVLVTMLVLAVVAYQYIQKKISLPDDNPIEQSIEAIIEDQFDIIIDLSPDVIAYKQSFEVARCAHQF